MLQIPDYFDGKAAEIISRHVSDRMISIMDEIINDYVNDRFLSETKGNPTRRSEELEDLYVSILEKYSDPNMLVFDEDETGYVKRIPIPDRTFLKKRFSLQFSDDDGINNSEELIDSFEDIEKYVESCFWDEDYLYLDEMSEEKIKGSALNKQLGIVDVDKTVVIDGPSGPMEVRLKIYPWDTEE